MALRDIPLVYLYRLQWEYSLGRRGRFLLLLGMMVLANVIYLLEPYVVGLIFNEIQLHGQDPGFFNRLVMMISLLLVTTVGFWLFNGPACVMERINAYLVKRDYQMDMLNKVLSLPASWHRDHHSGDTIDKVNRSSRALETFSANNYVVIEVLMRLFGSMAALMFLDIRAGLISVIVSLGTLWCINRFDRVLHSNYLTIYAYLNKVSAAIHDYLSNIFTVITLRLEERAEREVERRLMVPYPLHKKTQTLNELKWFFSTLMITLMTVVILILNAYDSYFTTGVVVIGTLYMLFGYLQRIGETFYAFAYRYGDIIEEHASVTSAQPIVQAYEALPEHERHHLPRDWKALEIHKLKFTYGKRWSKKSTHLDNVTLSIPRGAKIAFIGKSGSGKSTIMALMRGLYPAPNVDVYCDGDRLEHGLRHLFEHTTLIPQHPELFKATIRYNITLGLRFSEEDVSRVLRLSRFASVVRRLRKGLNAGVMEKGVSLSGGEKQRLALARGLLAGEKSDILLLDEPTSSVDSTNELAIYKSVIAAYPKKTIISAVHRLHLLHMFDYVYYFKHGKILAQGTFKEMQKNKHFAPMWRAYTKRR